MDTLVLNIIATSQQIKEAHDKLLQENEKLKQEIEVLKQNETKQEETNKTETKKHKVVYCNVRDILSVSNI